MEKRYNPNSLINTNQLNQLVALSIFIPSLLGGCPPNTPLVPDGSVSDCVTTATLSIAGANTEMSVGGTLDLTAPVGPFSYYSEPTIVAAKLGNDCDQKGVKLTWSGTDGQTYETSMTADGNEISTNGSPLMKSDDLVGIKSEK